MQKKQEKSRNFHQTRRFGAPPTPRLELPSCRTPDSSLLNCLLRYPISVLAPFQPSGTGSQQQIGCPRPHSNPAELLAPNRPARKIGPAHASSMKWSALAKDKGPRNSMTMMPPGDFLARAPGCFFLLVGPGEGGRT